MNMQSKYQFGIASDDVRKKAIKLHRQRYSEVGFLGETENDPYEANSIYFVAQEQESSQIVGVTRLIFKELKSLPTFEHFTIYDIDRIKLQRLDKNCYAEISAFTKLQKHEVGMEIIQTVFQYSLRYGVTHWICCIDERVYNYLTRIFGPVFKMIGEPKVYLGSMTIPCVLDIPAGKTVFKEMRPKLYEYLFIHQKQIMEVSK